MKKTRPIILGTLLNIFRQRRLLVSKLLFGFLTFNFFTTGEENLVDRIARMGTTNPLWVDVTWRAGLGLCEETL